MKRYIALLRGINIGGKNKISMVELKKGFIELEFINITTYLNSGNVIFSTDINDDNVLLNKINLMIKNKFNLDIPVFIILQDKLNELLNNAPDWWGKNNKEIYDNLIFLIPPLSYENLYNEIGEPKAKYEKIYNYNNIIFWSFNRRNYQKTNWWSKTASTSISSKITIRTANTIRKIAIM